MSTRNASAYTRTKRRVIQTGREKPFYFRGFLPALGLGAALFYGLFIFPFATIQQTARTSAQDALADINANWAEVRANGQVITLQGEAPSSAAAQRAKRAIEEVTNNTLPFSIRARPVTRVRNKATIKAAAETLAAKPTPQPSPQQTPQPHNWSYTLDRGVLELTGEVPDQVTQSTIMSAAARRQTSPSVSRVLNNLTITGRQKKEGYTETALRGVNVLSQCQAGTASFTDTVFALDCEADADATERLMREAKAPLSYGRLGRVEVYSVAETNSCNENMAELLAQTSIRFASNSAFIDPTSNRLLDRIAEAAQSCPGSLVIEGHTDNTGRASLNERLSRQRAETVRRELINRGIAAGRLEAQGYGPSRPIADNESEAGRALNRRIEIKGIRPGSSPH